MEHDHPGRPSDQREQHLQRPLAARVVAADEPDHRPTATGGAAARARKSDVDQTLATNINSVLSNTKVNTLRLTWTRENVAFANACFNGNGRDLSQVRADAGVPGLHRSAEQHRAVAHQRRAFSSTTRWPGSSPASTATTTSRSARSTEYSGAANQNQGNLNGTFAFGRSNALFNPADPRTYPDRFTIRVGGPSMLLREGALHRRVRAGQVAVQLRG